MIQDIITEWAEKGKSNLAVFLPKIKKPAGFSQPKSSPRRRSWEAEDQADCFFHPVRTAEIRAVSGTARITPMLADRAETSSTDRKREEVSDR